MDILVFGFGIVYCSVWFLFPYLYSFITTPDESVWVPVNNQYRLSGDDRIYASLVQESRLNFIKYQHPCASDIGNMSIDILRINSYRTAALLGLFLPVRFAYLVSFLLAILIQYCLIYFITFNIFHADVIALLVSVMTIFWYKILTLIDLPDGINHLIRYIKKRIINIDSDSNFDLINDNFRYVVLSVSGIYTWVTAAIILYSGASPDPYLFFAVLTVYFVIIPFIYPSITAIAVSVLGGCIIVEGIFAKEYTSILMMMAAGLAAIAILVLFGLLSKIKNIRNSKLDVLSMIHNDSDEYTYSFKSCADFLLKRALFIFPLLVLILIFPAFKSNLSILPVSLLLFVLLKIAGYLLKKNAVVYRFIERGGVHYLFFCLLVSGIYLLKSWGISRDILSTGGWVLLVPLTLLPLIGSFRMGISLRKSKSFYMPIEEWETYKYIQGNIAPRTMFLAFSFSNMQMLPVFTDANIYIRGAEWLELPENELKKYFDSVKFVRGNLDNLISEFDNYFSKRDLVKTEKINHSEGEFNGYELINTLIYFPYISAIAGIQVTNDDNSKWTEEFREYLIQMKNSTYDRFSWVEEIDYILVDRNDFLNISEVPNYFREIFSNNKYQLYGKA